MADLLCVPTTFEYGPFANADHNLEAQILRECSTTLPTMSEKTMKVHLKHSTTIKLKEKAVADKTGETITDLIQLLYDTSLLISSFNLNKPTQFMSVILSGVSGRRVDLPRASVMQAVRVEG